MKLSEAEWQIMNALWMSHPATARDRPRLAQVVRPDRLVAPEDRRVRAVLVGRPEALDPP